MDEKRREYIIEIAAQLGKFIRTSPGYASHPTYFDEGVIEYLDGKLRETEPLCDSGLHPGAEASIEEATRKVIEKAMEKMIEKLEKS